MRVPYALSSLLAATLVCGLGTAAAPAPFMSGPQAGSRLPGTFQPVPLNVTNAAAACYAGTRNDYVEQFGAGPVVLLFVRDVSDPLAKLVQKLNDAAGGNEAALLRVVVVLLSGEDAAERKLREFGGRPGAESVSLAVMPDGPEGYNVAKDADVTAVLYRRFKVEANYAFLRGDLEDTARERIASAASKLASGKR